MTTCSTTHNNLLHITTHKIFYWGFVWHEFTNRFILPCSEVEVNLVPSNCIPRTKVIISFCFVILLILSGTIVKAALDGLEGVLYTVSKIANVELARQ